jgi:large subunit ribosomal protein L24
MQGTRLKKGDMVKIISGKEKGKTGKILRIMHDKDKIIVEKLNIVKKHTRPDAKGKGGILEKEGPINASKVMYICNKCDTGVRVGFQKLEDGAKVRICRKCKETLDS